MIGTVVGASGNRGADSDVSAKPRRLSRRLSALERGFRARCYACYAISRPTRAALAGFTAAVIASDELGATGGANGLAFTFAITRISEIWIGIVCAGIVHAGTDLGGAQRRLATLLASLSADIASSFRSTLALTGSALSRRAAGSARIRATGHCPRLHARSSDRRIP